MVKRILLGLALILTQLISAMPAMAVGVKNPLIRTCHAYAGNFWLYNLGTAQEIASCQFGEVALGAMDFFLFTAGDKMKSVEAFEKATIANSSPDICQEFGAVEMLGVDTEQLKQTFCVFSDKSVITKNALQLGQGAAEVKGLVDALLFAEVQNVK